MKKETTLQRVLKLAANQIGMSADAVKPDDKLIADLGFDSLDSIELVTACEEDFDLEIPDSDAEKCETVADCAALIDKALAEQHAG